MKRSPPASERATCVKHADNQGASVTYEPEATEDEPDEHDCPFCFVEYVQRDYDNTFARMWALLHPKPEDGGLVDVPLHARVAVAWRLCEELSKQWSIDGDNAEESEYEADEAEARKLAGLPADFNASEAIEEIREVCQDVLERLKLPRTPETERRLTEAMALLREGETQPKVMTEWLERVRAFIASKSTETPS